MRSFFGARLYPKPAQKNTQPIGHPASCRLCLRQPPVYAPPLYSLSPGEQPALRIPAAVSHINVFTVYHAFQYLSTIFILLYTRARIHSILKTTTAQCTVVVLEGLDSQRELSAFLDISFSILNALFLIFLALRTICARRFKNQKPPFQNRKILCPLIHLISSN